MSVIEPIIQNASFSREITSSAQEIASFSQEIFVSPVFFPATFVKIFVTFAVKIIINRR
jgi:hypothetical protein